MGGKSGNKRVKPYTDKYINKEVKKVMKDIVYELEMEQFINNPYLNKLQEDYSFAISIPEKFRNQQHKDIIKKWGIRW